MGTENSEDRQAHWEDVYQRKPADTVSWFRPHLDMSLALLERAGLAPDSRVIDVGGGASTLVDDLLARGTERVTVLDLSAKALAVARTRLGERAGPVHWLAGDLVEIDLPPAGYDLWHDRAVLHFLTDPAAAERYAAVAAKAIRPGGSAVIGGFAPDGPEKCSGLLVARRSADDVAALLGPSFRLVEQNTERHETPAGNQQAFVWVRMLRTDA